MWECDSLTEQRLFVSPGLAFSTLSFLYVSGFFKKDNVLSSHLDGTWPGPCSRLPSPTYRVYRNRTNPSTPPPALVVCHSRQIYGIRFPSGPTLRLELWLPSFCFRCHFPSTSFAFPLELHMSFSNILLFPFSRIFFPWTMSNAEICEVLDQSMLDADESSTERSKTSRAGKNSSRVIMNHDWPSRWSWKLAWLSLKSWRRPIY